MMNIGWPELIIIFGIVAAGLLTVALYCLPTIIAVARKHRNRFAIGLVNIFLGWSVIGWFVALVWALTNPHHSEGSLFT